MTLPNAERLEPRRRPIPRFFNNPSLPFYDADAAALVVQRSRDFLDRLG